MQKKLEELPRITKIVYFIEILFFEII